MAASPDEWDLLWNAAEDALYAWQMYPDRRDRANGVLTSEPTTTAQWGELWRVQPTDPYYQAEANLHTVQRKATIRIAAAEEPGEYLLDVRIDRYRYRLEERQIDNAAAALRLYSSAAPTVSGRKARPEETAYWIPLGRDERMERVLLAEILRRAGQRAALAGTTQPASTPATQAARTEAELP